MYDTYWTIRGTEEFEDMFGRKPFTWVAGLDNSPSGLAQELQKELSREFDKVTIHFGEGRLNPSTIACMLAEIEQRIASRYGVELEHPEPSRARSGIF